ncbi:MAG: hypothetical protein OHK0029_05520 [Armatimonadaceae bacterium]
MTIPVSEQQAVCLYHHGTFGIGIPLKQGGKAFMAARRNRGTQFGGNGSGAGTQFRAGTLRGSHKQIRA